MALTIWVRSTRSSQCDRCHLTIAACDQARLSIARGLAPCAFNHTGFASTAVLDISGMHDRTCLPMFGVGREHKDED